MCCSIWVAPHGVERLGALPLRVVDDLRAVEAAVDGGRDEAREVTDHLFSCVLPAMDESLLVRVVDGRH